MTGILNLKRYGKGEFVAFRNPVDIDEAQRWCEAHSHIEFLSLSNDAREAKVNGKVKRWKRDPKRIEIPVKYGMYECARLNEHDLHRILIPVESE